MKRLGFAVLPAIAALAVYFNLGVRGEEPVQVARAPAGVLQKGSAYRFNRIRDDIYHAVGTGVMTTGANSVAIINESDVTLVDSHISPAAAWVLLDELKEITDKPVRYVINTHFHYDHAHGNQVFGPEVEIIGHEFTRDVLAHSVYDQRLFKAYLENMPNQIASLERRLAAETDSQRQEQLRNQLEAARANQASYAEFRPTPPTITIRDRMTIYRGDREIQLLFFGRGHTGGDVVVYLPAERVVCTGDLMTSGIANMVDGFADEWVDALEALKQLDFEVVLPGHGQAFTDRERIDHFQAYLRDIWTQVSRFKAQGLTAEQAAARVDLTAHSSNFSNIQGPGADIRAVTRIYEVLDMKGR